VNISFLLPLVLLFVVLWMFMIRPQRQRGQAQTQMQDNLRIGDEIITAGGLHGTVVSVEGEVVELELAPETVVRLDRRAVAAIVPPDEPEDEFEAEDEAEDEPEDKPEADELPKSASQPEEVAGKPVSSDDG
jgi:preprotein translocase subunit YajC